MQPTSLQGLPYTSSACVHIPGREKLLNGICSLKQPTFSSCFLKHQKILVFDSNENLEHGFDLKGAM